MCASDRARSCGGGRWIAPAYEITPGLALCGTIQWAARRLRRERDRAVYGMRRRKRLWLWGGIAVWIERAELKTIRIPLARCTLRRARSKLYTEARASCRDSLSALSLLASHTVIDLPHMVWDRCDRRLFDEGRRW